MDKYELARQVDIIGNDIFSFCVYLTQNIHDADDLYQDVWMKACSMINKLDESGNLKAFLFEVAANLWKSHRRKYARRKKIAPEEAFPDYDKDDNPIESIKDDVDVAEQVLNIEKVQRIRKAVERLKPKYKIPVLLFYMQEMNVREISEILHLPEGTIKSRLSRARAQLSKELEDYRYE